MEIRDLGLIIIIVMPLPLGGGLKQWCCLTSV